MQNHQLLKDSLQLGLNRFLILLACLLFFGSSYISNYKTTVNEAWVRWEILMYFNFTLMFFALRNETKKLITNTGYQIVLYLLINCFFDMYLKLKGWSWNDFLTVVFILLELIYKKRIFVKKDGN